MTTQKHLYLNEVQIAIFQQLLTYETLLKEGYRMDISRPASWEFWIYVYPAGHPEQSTRTTINSHTLTTAKDVDEAICRWWQSVPAEYKI